MYIKLTGEYKKIVKGQSIEIDGQAVVINDNWPRTVMTDANGKYTFENVPTYIELNSRRILAHYRLKLNSLPTGYENYAVTRYKQNGELEKADIIDSHLISQNSQEGAGYTDYSIESYLTSPSDGDYFITAKHSKEEGAKDEEGNKWFEEYIIYDDYVLNNNDHDYAYDYIKADDYDDFDGGVKEFEQSSISGVIWNDTNYNGVFDEDETEYFDADNYTTVVLKQYYYKSGKWIDAQPGSNFKTFETKTGGSYSFDNLPTFVEVDGVKYLAGYKVSFANLPTDYVATKYWNVDNPDKVYSKLYVTDIEGIEDSQRTTTIPVTVLENDDEYIITAK